MSVDLVPEELGFRRPFSHEVSQVLRITNNNSTPVAFKVKTTAPKQYCVRPNSGLVRPHDAVEVQVLLQAMKEDPPLDARCRDKFLVQSVQVDETDENNVAALWSNIERTAKGSIQEKKIRVQFLQAGSGYDAPHVNGGLASTSEEQPPAYAASSYGSPGPASDVKSTSGTTSVNRAVTAAAETTSNTASSAAASVSNAIPRSQDDVNAQLASARAQITELTNQLADPQVRQRKIAETQEKVQQVVQQAQNTGVPLQIVALLCLASFLIAYLFF
ncbi:phosphatidylinositol-binding protein scs2 [Lithohypha guttulata]|uniref:Phosphatidylinositol-binding protein scs2 n=1 Tax=Lithohypha guttulata TaxID=1690604 RepID=A0AAN7SZR5_9EURO|nr:phosphatidylinositol-binding protein scs2 [Lithohypha guttulata]